MAELCLDCPKPANPSRPCEDCRQRHDDTCRTKGYCCGDDNNGWQPIEKPSKRYRPEKEINPEAKEKPMLAKFTSRRYVMLCTLYVTTKIAIVLNPWLFRLAGLVRPEWGSIRGKLIREGNGNYIREMIPVPWDSGNWQQIAGVWACAILVCTAICGAIYAFNKATAWIFGEKK